MKKTITRRDLLKFASGSALGILFTPLPWKLLDDSAIWTQNWSLTPPLSHGVMTSKFSVCTLCPAGCSVHARCVDGIPFALSGIEENPIDRGILCSRGLTGHHLAYHPLRITIPHKFSGKEPGSRLLPCSIEHAVKDISTAIQNAEGSIVIFDRNPRRITSQIYKDFTQALKNGIHSTISTGEDTTLLTLEEMSEKKNGSFGYDFENTKMIVSFGAPLLDGFGIPGAMATIFNSRKESGLQLIQIESRQSRTALKADQWLAVNPGSDGILALSIANVLLTENLTAYKQMSRIHNVLSFKNIIRNYSPEQTSSLTGIEPNTVRILARQLASSPSSIVLSGADSGGGPLPKEAEKAIAALNIMLGNVGKSGGIVMKKNSTDPALVQWSDIPDHSVSVLIIDSAETGYALPWQVIEKKLIPKTNIVVSLSPFISETTAHSDYILPIATFYESLRDVPGQNIFANETFAIAQPLLKKSEGTIEESEFIEMLAASLKKELRTPPYEQRIKNRIADIFQTKKGTVFSFTTKTSESVATLGSADDLYSKMIEGALWMDEGNSRTNAANLSYTINIDPISLQSNISKGSDQYVLMPFGWRGAISSSSVSPVMSKLFQESELRCQGNVVLVNPKSLKRVGLSNADIAVIKTEHGSCSFKIRTSNSVALNVLEAAVAPLNNNSSADNYLSHSTILSLCDVQSDGTWRTTNATIRKQIV